MRQTIFDVKRKGIKMKNKNAPQVQGYLRDFMLTVG